MFQQTGFILFVIAVIFGGVYLWLATPIPDASGLEPRFDWPDETANYFWSKKYAREGSLVLAEPLNIFAEDQIHPRSFNVREDGSLVPGSFLGLIMLYGALAKVFSAKAIIYFTPIISILGSLSFYGIIKKIFNEHVALISGILMLAHPAWWYYSVTTMLPNVTFVSLIIISIYFLVGVDKIKLHSLLLSAFLFGLAVSIRPSEIVWIGFIYLAVIFYLKDKLKISRLVVFLIVAFLAVTPSLSAQQAIYGGYLTSGYDQLNSDNFDVCQSCAVAKSFILPFGFHPTSVALNFWTHFLSRLWWLSLLTLLGLVAFLVQPDRQKPEIFAYVLMSLFVFGWLAVYYGSWQFTDLLTVHLNRLGISYIRYWLPLFVLSLPFAALGLIWLTRLLRNRWQDISLFVLLGLLIYQSANLVLRAHSDSILPVRDRIASYKQSAAEVINITEPEGVIVTVRKDKLFFPERKVIHTFQALSLNNDLQKILPGLADQVPVYYYALGPEPVLEFDNGLELSLVKRVGQEVLYELESRIKN